MVDPTERKLKDPHNLKSPDSLLFSTEKEIFECEQV